MLSCIGEELLVVILILIITRLKCFSFQATGESSYPEGPYALPMSKDGCPEASSQGWGEGYINITTRMSLYDPISYPESCQQHIHDVLFTLQPNNPAYKTNILGPFNQYTVQLNFCFRFSGSIKSTNGTWPPGNYGVFGTDNGCPTGMSKYELAICFPPLLHYNIDGHVPYVDIREEKDGAVVLFSYCRHEGGEENETMPFDSFNPYMMIKDPVHVEHRYPYIEGYEIIDENFPGPMPTTILGLNTTYPGNTYPHFSLGYCHVIPKHYILPDKSLSSGYSALFYENGFPGDAFPLTDVTVTVQLRNECDNKINEPNPSIGCETVQAWIMIDIRRSALVSAIMIATITERQRFKVDVTQFFVANQRWGFLYDGALLCRHNEDNSWSVDHTFACYKPHLGRFVTLRTSPYLLNTGNDWNYSETYITILSFNSTEVHTMMNKYKDHSFFGPITRHFASVIKYTDTESKTCRQELGMKDFGIWDTQLTASSWKPSHEPIDARPQFGGWCASSTDANPYLQVDLVHITAVDGIVLINWFELIDSHENNIYKRDMVAMGSISIHINFGSDLENLQRTRNYTYDVSGKLGEPQTFIFSDPFLARYLRVFPRPFPATNITCLKIEILGCRISDSVSLHCEGSSSRVISHVSRIFVSANNKANVYANLSSLDCEAQCLHNETDCISTHYKADGSCLLFHADENRNYITVTTHDAQDVLSMVTCVIDEKEKAPYFKLGSSSSWTVYKESLVSQSGILTNMGYPLTYAYNSVFRWKIDLPEKYVIIQFMEISLRNFEDYEAAMFSLNRCYDSISVSEHMESDNMYHFKDFSDKPGATHYNLFSDISGRMPAFSMGGLTHGSSVYITLYSCRAGNVLDTGRGFRVHVQGTDVPFCLNGNKQNQQSLCLFPEMELISKTFLGQVDTSFIQTDTDTTKSYYWLVFVGSSLDNSAFETDSLVMTLEFKDFDINCHSESAFEIVNELGRTEEYCNLNRFYGMKLAWTGYRRVKYTPSFQGAVHTFFPEGFQLSYKCIPKQETLPYNHTVYKEERENSESITRACVDALGKCYTISTVDNYSWEDVAFMCQRSNSSMVNIKNFEEMSVIRSLLILHYRDKSKANLALELFIGLRRYVDSYGIQHEYWTDGSPLTFTAWDKVQPADTIRLQCTKMRFHPPSDSNTWRTQHCQDLVQGLVMTAVCEEAMPVSNTLPLEPIQDSFNNSSISVNPRDPATLFECSSGELTSALARCNGISECSDSSDEMYCNRTAEGLCTTEEFTCTDGRCIHVSKVCDFVEDCQDAADELCKYPTCSLDQYECTSGQCIPSNGRCDAITDCLDASDEISCDKCNHVTAFQCGDKSCISKRLVCDMHFDCPDGADEISCDHELTTCDDFWLDGITNNGYYHIGEAYYIYCNFDSFGKDGGWIKMHYLNTDWKQLSVNEFRLETAGIRRALLRGYQCYQKFSSYPRREKLRVMELDNTTFTQRELEYRMDTSFINDYGLPFSVQKNLDDGAFESFTLTVNRYFDIFEDRMKLGRVECNRYFPSSVFFRESTLFCRSGVQPINEKQRCLYNKDENGIIDGCRSLSHLQNCELFTCPHDYVKCPDSFCIPLMYMCNGEMDCPDGYDEKVCACEDNERKIIIMAPIPSVDDIFHETVARLGGLLFTKSSRVKILRYEQHMDGILRESLKRSTKPAIKLFSSDILTYGGHRTTQEKAYELNKEETRDFLEGFYSGENEEVVSGIIWLTNEHVESPSENIVLSQLNHFEKNYSTTVVKYHVVIGRNTKSDIFPINKRNIKEIYVRDANILRTTGTQFFPEICTGNRLPCKGSYRCLFSKICIPLNQMCDSRKQCPNGDDEENCSFKCPNGCSCGHLIINCSNIISSNITFEKYIPARVLDISNSTDICKDFLENQTTRQSLMLLISLNMSRCNVKILSRSSFDVMQNLKTLDLTFNKFTKLPRDVFHNLKALMFLKLTGNFDLREIEPGAFNGISVKTLTINFSKVKTLLANTFEGLRLDYLDMKNNEISSVQDLTFNSLKSNTIDIRGNPVTKFTTNMFRGVIGVKKLKAPAFKFCCIRPSYLNEEHCQPKKDEFSSCEDLMRNGTLQALMWTIGTLALIGNILSLLYRTLYDRKRLRLGYGIFVTNLAIADLMMGVYMLIIAVADKIFRNRYIEVDEYWRNSVWCQLAGILSTVSSEASVLFMCLITIDRILVIKYPFGQLRFNLKTAILAAVATWVFVVTVSLLPILYKDYFKGEFYSRSAVCLALPLTRDRPNGWLYSILLFIGFNMVTFVLIAVGQLLIYVEIKKNASHLKTMNMTRTNDLKVARNLLLIVTTDFLCWFPIGMMGTLALAGKPIPGEVYAWTAVLVLPINSALNPFMYTLTAIFSSQKFSPSVEEQSRTDMQKEIGKSVVKLYQYVPTYRQKRNASIISLHDLIESRRLTPHQIVHLAVRILCYIDLLHEHDLVLRGITENRIFIAVLDNGQFKRNIQIDVHGYYGTSTKRNVTADDLYNYGCLLDRILSKRNTP